MTYLKPYLATLCVLIMGHIAFGQPNVPSDLPPAHKHIITVPSNEIYPSENELGVVEERSKKHRIVVDHLGGFKSLFLKMFDT